MIYNLKYVNDNGDALEFSMKTNIIVNTASGFTENYIDLSLSQGINQIGSTVQGQAVQSKDIVVTGELTNETMYTRRQLLRAIKPLVPARLIYNDTWEIMVYPTQTPIVEKSLINARFQFTLKAPFPYWKSIEGNRVILSQIEPVFEFPWDLSQPIFMFGGRKEGLFGNVYNSGDIDVPFKIIFMALDNLENPRLTNILTGEIIRLNTEMRAGEQIIVDIMTTGISIISNYIGIETDIFSRLDIDSNFYRMHPGDNVVRYDADPDRGGLDVQIYYNVLRVGVYD